MDLCGYILKSDSPSCGMERVRVYGESGMPSKTGVGIFARALMDRFPLLPVEEEGRLHDLPLAGEFRGAGLLLPPLARPGRPGASRAGSWWPFTPPTSSCSWPTAPSTTPRWGNSWLPPRRVPRESWKPEYGELFMTALKIKATAKKHVNVMQHILGYLKRDLDAKDKGELLALIGDYHKNLVPLVVPLTLLKHHLARIPVPYIEDQVYLYPHPKELMLRNHV